MPAPVTSYISPYRSIKQPLLIWLAIIGVLLALLGLISAPLMGAYGFAVSSRMIYGGFSQVCHQIPERSFYLADHPYAVCARCYGIYAGLALGALLYPLLVRRPFSGAGPPSNMRPLLVAAIPTTIDFALGWFQLWDNTHYSRSLTSGVFGIVAAFYIVPVLTKLKSHRS